MAQIATPASAPDIDALKDLARQVRVAVIRSVEHAGAGHIGGPLSAADLLVALYFRMLRIRPEQPNWPDRDRFILSKGHSSIALYAAMALRGYFEPLELSTFDTLDSRLQGHPDMTLLPGIDMSTGSLGLGISAGVGIALGAQLRQRDFRVYVLVGDGECQEGSVWEAATAATRYRLANLTVIVDDNGLQQYGWSGNDGRRESPFAPGELHARWAAAGWRVIECDGHDFDSILHALEEARATRGRPSTIVARTVKGKGVPFMEHQYEWHSRVPSADELAKALAALVESK